MDKPVITKKLLKFILSVSAVVIVFLVFGISASAKTYNSIKLDVPRISQHPGIGDCAIASMATVEAYCHKLPAGDYNSRAYQAVYSANGYSISASWTKLGYQAIDGFSMETIYNQLKTGYPAIVYRTSSHYSVVYGYDGNKNYLEKSGFLLVDVDDSYNGKSSAYMRLDNWQRSYSLTRMVIRLDGLNISHDGITYAGNHPAAVHIKGDSFSARGMVISNSKLTSVTVAVKSSNGKTVQTYSASPNSTSFAVSKANGTLDFTKLSVGSYYFSVYAKDSSGATKTFNYDFNVALEGSVPVVEDEPTVKTVSYTAVVKADPSLNLRKNPGVDAAKITSVPYGEKVSVTAESSNGWAMVNYNNYVGWVSKQYIEKYVEPVIEPTPVEPIPIGNVRYARCTAATSLKSTTFLFSSNVVSVPKNAIMRIVGIENGWLQVKYSGKTGYVPLNVCVADIFDVDFNGAINSADALIVLEAASGKKKLSDGEKKVADADGNGVVNSADALTILQVSSGSKTF